MLWALSGEYLFRGLKMWNVSCLHFASVKNRNRAL